MENISARFNEGSVNAILGVNGAGKSTLIKIVSGALRPSKGSVIYAGCDVARRKDWKRSVGLAMGNRSRLVWDLAARETFELHRAIYGLDPNDFEHTLEELDAIFDLSGLLVQPTRTFSLGQRVRVEVALAMLHKPKVLLLDECSIGLDMFAKSAYHKALRHISTSWGTCVIQATNDLTDVETSTQNILVLSNQQNIFFGTIEELIEKYAIGKDVSIRCAKDQVAQVLSVLGASGYGATVGDDGQILVRSGAEPLGIHEVAGLFSDQPVEIHSIEQQNDDISQILKKMSLEERR